MPFDVAVEEEDTWVGGAEAEHEVAERVCHDGVTAHGDGRELCCGGVGRVVESSVRGGAGDGLELVAVEMERVAAVVEIVDYDFDN